MYSRVTALNTEGVEDGVREGRVGERGASTLSLSGSSTTHGGARPGERDLRQTVPSFLPSLASFLVRRLRVRRKRGREYLCTIMHEEGQQKWPHALAFVGPLLIGRGGSAPRVVC